MKVFKGVVVLIYSICLMSQMLFVRYWL